MAASETSIATEATRTAVIQNAADYAGGIAAHVAGDYGKHNQFNWLPYGPFQIMFSPPDEHHANHIIPYSSVLRTLTTINTVDTAIVIPTIYGGVFVGNGTWSGSPSAVAPVFALQPTGGDYTEGSALVLSIEVSGTPPIFLQWQQNGVAIGGATGNSLVFTSFQEGDAGDYTCIATNAKGQTISVAAVLALRTSAISSIPNRPA